MEHATNSIFMSHAHIKRHRPAQHRRLYWSVLAPATMAHFINLKT